ncbi:MAG: acyl-CoA carboxylase subunit beta [Hyphomicrobiales bacterium]|nr:acyl-CoA carboxylase subunit beta [Hyphomicrobiales bacterium]MCP5370601.1 acyl-CoA carboxylase subunit beta [Hyphomicrobiales bacterium]
MDESTIEELERLRREGRAMGGADKVARLHEQGKLTARERVDQLLDPGTFVEIGILGRSQHGDLRHRTPADGLVAGWGKIDGRQVYVTSEDATVVAGTRGRVAETKTARVRELAYLHKAPYIALMEAGAGRFQEANGAMAAGIGHRFREHYKLSGRAPVIAAFMGMCFGGPSFTAMQSDFVTIVKGTGFMGMSGPPVVKVGIGRDVTPDEIGGAEKATKITGQADYLAEDEADCLRSIRRFLSYFPHNCFELPPRAEPRPAPMETPEGRDKITRLVSDNHRRAYDMEQLVRLFVDDGEIFHYRELYGRNLITAWARIDGEVVGVVGNQPKHWAGALDDKATRKARKFVELCDAYHIPLVFLTDCPGFIVGPDIENQGMVSLASRFLNTIIATTVPITTIVVRKAIGLAYIAMAGKTMEPDAIVAYPTAQFDMMGPAAGVELTYGKEIAAAPDPAALRKQYLDKAEEAASAYLAAEMALIDDVIHPAETRDVIRSVLDRVRTSRVPGFKHRIDP